jgi:hypothetical protein
VSNGAYHVVLQFAENYWSLPGQRVFDVLLESTQVVDDLDIVGQVSNRTGLTLDLPVIVSDGELNVRFNTVVDNAQLTAIRVERR